MKPIRQEFYAMTDEDQYIMLFHVGAQEHYEYSIADRNDYGVMLARTTLVLASCRATRDRAMPAA